MISGKVKTGLDQVAAKWPKVLNGARIGLVVHPASVDRRLRYAASVCLESRKFRLKALFGPQHGIRGETQDNMIEWEGFRDQGNGLPVFSLYGKTRRPTPEMLRGLDALVIDLQDVGARYYTFIWTMALIMQACRETGKAVVVLDRPNPIGGKLTEGPVLAPEYSSFVGLHPLPVRHGMTIGEIALYLQTLYSGVQLHIISMTGWTRSMWFDDSGLPWVLPSPNMPTVETAAVYPGMCLLEGTNLNEGRGTTRPFEIFGAPFIEPDKLVGRLSGFGLGGVVFRPLYFLPTFQKHAGTLCGGAQIHVTDRRRFKPFKTGVGIVKAVFDLYPKDFSWNNPPYEYEERLMPIDILAGTDRLRKDIEAGRDLNAMELWWDEELMAFDREIRTKTLLYT
ncbi:MAG: DUF1343 domain-containing protein [Nitrospiraceae bacterium]|nr:DUF1343 domain-containing protein [Nitrospiraceae bacterium]